MIDHHVESIFEEHPDSGEIICLRVFDDFLVVFLVSIQQILNPNYHRRAQVGVTYSTTKTIGETSE